jgi:TonB family protein
MFDAVAGRESGRHPLASLAVSGVVHVALASIVVLIASVSPPPHAAALPTGHDVDPTRLVFVATPGPGGGGGGSGHLEPAPPPPILREGNRRISSPLPVRVEPKPIEPARAPVPPPTPVLAAERLPLLVAPIVSAPADARDRRGVPTPSPAQAESLGPGRGGGAGAGSGSGLGSGDGSGVGPGSGGGTGGGPYRAGSGIEPPRLLREVKADYTEDARQRGIAGAVVLEIVVRKDGAVGDVRVLEGLAGGLNDRAIQAVRQWRFAPAERHGAPVDVIVEVAVEFSLR